MSGKAIQAADTVIDKMSGQQHAPPPPGHPHLTVAGKYDESRRMKAVAWHGKEKVSIKEMPVPLVTDPTDAVIKVTSSCICGSDLHLYEHSMPGMKNGDVLGHEFMGIVEEVGPEVKHLKKGDRVVCCFDIGCGACFFCKHDLWSSCASSNPSHVQEAMYGQTTGGFYGYSHLTGGWQGGQAEYVRVPVADVNCLKVPDQMPDNKVILLSDILPTAWHACELGEVHKGDVVAIWGAGPVGILAAHCAQYRGAKRVILIDPNQYRLDFASSKLPGVETVNRSKRNPLDALKELCATEQGGAPDVTIDAVGMHYATSLIHKVQAALQLETDTPEVVNECVKAVRKGGRVALIAAYGGFVNAFNLGAFMEKQLTMRGGQTPCQKYWHDLLKKVERGELDPTIVITHPMPLEEAAKGYEMFNAKREGDRCVKVVLKTPLGLEREGRAATAQA